MERMPATTSNDNDLFWLTSEIYLTVGFCKDGAFLAIICIPNTAWSTAKKKLPRNPTRSIAHQKKRDDRYHNTSR